MSFPLLTRAQWKEICPFHGLAEPLYCPGGRLYKYTFRLKVFEANAVILFNYEIF